MYQCVGRLGTVQVCTWRRLGTVQVLEEIRGFYNCLEEIGVCTSVWRGLGSVPVFGGDWVLYKCVEDIWFLKLPRLGSVQVCEENKVLY